MKKTFGLAIAMWCLGIVVVAMFAGCNTVKGIGKDIQSGGQAIERSTGK